MALLSNVYTKVSSFMDTNVSVLPDNIEGLNRVLFISHLYSLFSCLRFLFEIKVLAVNAVLQQYIVI